MKTRSFKIPKVIQFPGLDVEVVKIKMDTKYGESDDEEARIFIDPQETIEVQRDTLFHEMSHMLLDYWHACRQDGVCT